LKNALTEKGFEKDILAKIKVEKVAVCATFEPAANAPKKVFDQITFQQKVFDEYTLLGDKPTQKDPQQTQEDFDIEKYFEAHLAKYFWKIAHRIVFWKSDSKHLINEQINLDTFAADPENTSIPLMNCFELAGVEKDDITSQVAKLKTDPAEINNLQEKLGDKVTAHIKKFGLTIQSK